MAGGVSPCLTLVLVCRDEQGGGQAGGAQSARPMAHVRLSVLRSQADVRAGLPRDGPGGNKQTWTQFDTSSDQGEMMTRVQTWEHGTWEHK